MKSENSHGVGSGDLLSAGLEEVVEMLAERTAEILLQKMKLDQGAFGAVDMGAEMMDVMQAAEYLRLSSSTLYKLSSRGKLAVVKLGGRVRFRRADLDAYVAEHRRDGKKVLTLATEARRPGQGGR